jgi:hypothetical protein
MHFSAGYPGSLRRELCSRNHEFAQAHKLDHVLSYGTEPVVVYAPNLAGNCHGNFYGPSYAAILKRREWGRRLDKIHAQGRRALPRAERRWRELDSCISSDALMMNIFCGPRVCSSKEVAAKLGTEITDAPEFGYKARVPLKRVEFFAETGKKRKVPIERFDRTEVDMKLGALLVEAKLTETNFQRQSKTLVESYRDLEEVFEVGDLPRADEDYLGYQLVRNVLAAHASGSSFCLMLDARRPDLLERWHEVLRCVRDSNLRTRCKVLQWQELAEVLPSGLSKFLLEKYGIEGG